MGMAKRVWPIRGVVDGPVLGAFDRKACQKRIWSRLISDRIHDKPTFRKRDNKPKDGHLCAFALFGL